MENICAQSLQSLLSTGSQEEEDSDYLQFINVLTYLQYVGAVILIVLQDNTWTDIQCSEAVYGNESEAL